MKNRKSIILCTLLALSVFGCTMIFPPHPYIPPDLPKTELATIEIDTQSEYLKHITSLEVRIDRKLAVRQKIDINKNISIDDVLVTAGEHNITAIFVAETSPNPRDYQPKRKQIATFDVDLKVGGTYLIILLSAHIRGGGLYIELIDKETNKVVHKQNMKIRYTPRPRYRY